MSYYQPPLLSLGDMLNIPGDDSESDWTDNPFSISHFFDPIVTETQPSSEGVAEIKEQSDLETVKTEKLEPTPASQDWVSAFEHLVEPSPTGDHQEFVDELDFFNENELSGLVDEEECQDPELEPVVGAVPLLPFRKRKEIRDLSQSPTKESSEPNTSKPKSIPKPGKSVPVLVEVNTDNASGNNIQDKQAEKCRQTAIDQLNSLIGTLKQYKIQLETFLNHQGNQIIETYNAKLMLSCILPDDNEPSSSQPTDPFSSAHSITRAVIHSSRETPPIFTLPPKAAPIWRGSDILLLQKSILESVIKRREFFINCRYTDLLSQMGFDSDDLVRLESSQTEEDELGLMEIIINEHEFFSQFRDKAPLTSKPAISRIVILPPFKVAGAPRVMFMPEPKTLVTDKWAAIREIHRATVFPEIKDDEIDWLFVVKKMSESRSPLKPITEAVCKLTYEHLLSFKYNNYHWDVAEVRKLKTIREEHPNASWSQVAHLLGTYRTPFSCFLKFKMYCTRRYSSFVEMTPSMMNTTRHFFEQCGGNAAQVAHLLSRTTKKTATVRRLLMWYRKMLSPRNRKGNCSMVENILLLVTVEMYKFWILESSESVKFQVVGYVLPWRYHSYWLNRFRVLLTNFYAVKWTMEEDKRLLQLTEEHGSNYKRIEREFPLRDRKQCAGRLQRLRNVLKTGTLEDYHKFYSIRAKCKGIQRLNDIRDYLEATIQSKLMGNRKQVRQIDLEFLKLQRKPSDYELECYLMTFPVQYMKQTLDRLNKCIAVVTVKVRKYELEVQSRNQEEEGKRTTWLREMVQKVNRKLFDPECPFSIASALFVHRAQLVPRESLDTLTEFENTIYEAYDLFQMRSAGRKKNVSRNIPTVEQLRKLTRVRRLLAPPLRGCRVREGEASVVVVTKTRTVSIAERDKEEQALLEELEQRRAGAKRKGSTRKGARTKLARKQAAMLRWAKSRSDSQQSKENDIPEESEGGGDGESCLSPRDQESLGSSHEEYSNNTASNAKVSSAALRPTIRRALIGFYSDHAYIHPMVSPYDRRAFNFFSQNESEQAEEPKRVSS